MSDFGYRISDVRCQLSDFGCQTLFYAVACVIYHRQQHNSLASFAVARVIHHGQHNNSLAPICRKEFQPIILSLRIAGRFHHIIFCSCKLQEGFIAQYFVPANCRKVSSHNILLLQIAGRFHHTMFCSCK